MTLTAEKQGYTFFEKTIDKNTQNIVINASTSVSGGISFSGLSQNYKNQVKILVNQVEHVCNVEDFSFDNVTLNTIIKPVGDGLVFEPSEVVVTQENQQIQFECKKLYSFSARIISGGVPLENVEVAY